MDGQTKAIGIRRDEDGRVCYDRVRLDQNSRIVPWNPEWHYSGIILGLEDTRYRFVILREVGEGVAPLLERFPSIVRSEDRIEYRFTDENEMFLFRMLWQNPPSR